MIPNLERALARMWHLYRRPADQPNIGIGPMALQDCEYYRRRGHLLFFEFQLTLVKLIKNYPL